MKKTKKNKYKYIKYLIALFHDDGGFTDSAVLFKINSINPHEDGFVRIVRAISNYPNRKVIRHKYYDLTHGDEGKCKNDYVPHITKRGKVVKIFEDDIVMSFNDDTEAQLWFELNVANLLER